MSEHIDLLASVLHKNSCANTCPFRQRCQDKALDEVLPAECKNEHNTLTQEIKDLSNGVIFDSKGVSQRMGLTVWVRVENEKEPTPIVLRDGKRMRY